MINEREKFTCLTISARIARVGSTYANVSGASACGLAGGAIQTRRVRASVLVFDIIKN